MVKVFTYNTPASGRSPHEIAEDTFAAFNAAPSSGEAAALARQYRQRRLRSLSVGDMVVVGETALTVASAGSPACAAPSPRVRVHEHGTHPVE